MQNHPQCALRMVLFIDPVLRSGLKARIYEASP
jgi:hypothetical protein